MLPVRRLLLAFSTLPDAGDWGRAAGLPLIAALVFLPVGFRTGLLRFAPLRAPWRTLAGIAVAALFTPALAEELIFRVCLLPHPVENASAEARWLWGLVGVAVFVAGHPLRVVALRRDSPKRAAFTNPTFLLLAALLGGACTLAYLGSGSLWPPVAIHGIVVIVWLLLFGGWERLYPPPLSGKKRAAAACSEDTS